MAIAFVNITTAQLNASNTSVSINVPTGVVNGNLMITIVENNAAVTVTPPGGWTQLATFPLNIGNSNMDGYYRIASSEPASYTWSFGSSKTNIACLAYSGTHATTPISVSSGGTSASNPVSSPTISTPNNDWNVCGFGDRDSSAGSSWTTPTGTQNRANMLNTGTSQGSLAVFDTNGTVTAGSYSYTSTSSTTNNNVCCFTIAIAPAASGSLPPVVNVRQAVNRATSF